ncbi:MAG: hypothetical protein ACREI3_12570 [Nitrospirales bacterium]
MKERTSSLLGAGVMVPRCCITPAPLSLVGITGLSLGLLTNIDAALFPYLAILAVALLGRAHYLIHIKHVGNRLSRMITWGSTGLVAAMWAVHQRL